MYLCFLKMWKALSLSKLDRLSVSGWNGTEWMNVDTEGESWNIYKWRGIKVRIGINPSSHVYKIAKSTRKYYNTLLPRFARCSNIACSPLISVASFTVISFQYQAQKVRLFLHISTITSKLCVANISKLFCRLDLNILLPLLCAWEKGCISKRISSKNLWVLTS